ncbi:hypothetical protein FI667_g7934, partial [Globisporangium splendens]
MPYTTTNPEPYSSISAMDSSTHRVGGDVIEKVKRLQQARLLAFFLCMHQSIREQVNRIEYELHMQTHNTTSRKQYLQQDATMDALGYQQQLCTRGLETWLAFHQRAAILYSLKICIARAKLATEVEPLEQFLRRRLESRPGFLLKKTHARRLVHGKQPQQQRPTEFAREHALLALRTRIHIEERRAAEPRQVCLQLAAWQHSSRQFGSHDGDDNAIKHDCHYSQIVTLIKLENPAFIWIDKLTLAAKHSNAQDNHVLPSEPVMPTTVRTRCDPLSCKKRQPTKLPTRSLPLGILEDAK